MALAADSVLKYFNAGAELISSGKESTPSSGVKHFNDIAAKILQPSLTSQFVVSITEPTGEDWGQAKKEFGRIKDDKIIKA